MSIAEIQKAERLNRLRQHIVEAITASRTMEGFLAATGLTSEHLIVARIGIHVHNDLVTALEWVIDNGASPSEMMAWHRLQNGDEIR